MSHAGDLNKLKKEVETIKEKVCPDAADKYDCSPSTTAAEARKKAVMWLMDKEGLSEEAAKKQIEERFGDL